MSSVLRSALRAANTAYKQINHKTTRRVFSGFCRPVWHMSSQTNSHASNQLCGCGCRSLIHTKGEGELVNFLREEIIAEKKGLKMKSLPKELDGFVVKTDGADLELIKSGAQETITISLNVNHSVDTDIEPQVDQKADNLDLDLKSKPNFEVDITRGGQTLSFSCSYTEAGQEEVDEAGYNDAFTINEVSLFEGELEDNTYSVSGDVLDGNLYDIFMTVLEEKGISSEFADKLSDIATAHEHSLYINMLEKLSKFSSK